MDEELTQALEVLRDLQDDNTLPKNVRSNVSAIIETLENEGAELSIRIDKAMQDLEDISSDINIQPYSRTQIYHVVSLLENSH